MSKLTDVTLTRFDGYNNDMATRFDTRLLTERQRDCQWNLFPFFLLLWSLDSRISLSWPAACSVLLMKLCLY